MQKSRKDFIFDLETIGANVHVCPVVDMSYATFEWDRFGQDPYTFEELITDTVKTVKLSVNDQMANYNCSFKRGDVEWWEKLPEHARQKLKPTTNDLTVSEFCDSILEYLREQVNIDYWWSRGNTFDPIILWRLMNKEQTSLLDQYLKYYKVRDIRTHIDAKFDYTTRSGFVPVADEKYWNQAFVAHDSIHDVAADILRLQAIFRAESDLEHINR
jgi:hypothetical protein